MANHNFHNKHTSKDNQPKRDGRKAKHAIMRRDEKRARKYNDE